MFNTNKQQQNGKMANNKSVQAASPSINLIGTGTEIEGDIKCSGDIRIDGKLIGTVTSKAKVVIGSTGVVSGDIFGETADISGNVTGKINVDQLLFLKSTADVKGDIITGKLVVESGAKFNGACSMGGNEIQHGKQFTPTLKKEAV